jgi:hypothetical protein
VAERRRRSAAGGADHDGDLRLEADLLRRRRHDRRVRADQRAGELREQHRVPGQPRPISDVRAESSPRRRSSAVGHDGQQLDVGERELLTAAQGRGAQEARRRRGAELAHAVERDDGIVDHRPGEPPVTVPG